MSKYIKSITRMMRRVFNTLDYRLMDHGDRVAYLVLQMYKEDADINFEQLSKICYLSMFHDIGAYQTEPLDSLCDQATTFYFELKNTIPHSVYSYIFFNEHECFKEYSEGLLFHHFPYDKLIKSDCNNKKFAARLFMADRIDMLINRNPTKNAKEILELLDNPTISREDLYRLELLEHKHGILTKAIQGAYNEELMVYLAKIDEEEELEALIHMVPHAIDFKSEHTVTHTIATVEISMAFARIFDFDEFHTKELYYGALLHDIGKVAISTMVLEKNGLLTDEEFKYMKDHVVLSEHILKDCVSDDVLNIAVRHHEKLNGRGYPHGLNGDVLNGGQRIVAVADVLSALLGRRSYKEPFSRDRVVPIIENMRDTNQLCPKAVDSAIEHFDLINETVQNCSIIAVDRYNYINKIATELTQRCENFSARTN